MLCDRNVIFSRLNKKILVCLVLFSVVLVKFRFHLDKYNSKRSLPAIDGSHKTVCEIPVLVQDGVPWPECTEKIMWMNNHWKSEECYSKHGVDGSFCSILHYLTYIEKVCPPERGFVPKSNPLYFKGTAAIPRSSLKHLIDELSGFEDLEWIGVRIAAMQHLWLDATHNVFSKKLKNVLRVQKKIHIHLGLMEIGMGKDAKNGGPLGELVQWADLIASLYLMGHEMTVSTTINELKYAYFENNRNSKDSCHPTPSDHMFPFDIVYTDIMGYVAMSKLLKNFKSHWIKCRFRIIDSFGTEARFNAVPRKSKESFGGFRLDLKQFNTMFPHTPDNTFLGFVVENLIIDEARLHKKAGDEHPRRDIAVVYGKDGTFWEGSKNYLEIINEYVTEVHGTVSATSDMSDIPSFVVNHDVLPFEDLLKLLHRAKIFVGLGFPYEGPAPLEAIAMGAKFLNPKFNVPVSCLNSPFYQNKPTRRSIRSQNPYAEEYIGKPYVYTIDIKNKTELRAALQEIQEATDDMPYLPHEFSAEGMLERVAIHVEKQQFCQRMPFNSTSSPVTSSDLVWPPLSSLEVVVATNGSCNEACRSKKLICEPTFFPAINRKEVFEELNFTCKSVRYPTSFETDYPAYDRYNQACYIQTNNLYFSCAEKKTFKIRLCPCRDFMEGQVALCKNCLS